MQNIINICRCSGCFYFGLTGSHTRAKVCFWVVFFLVNLTESISNCCCCIWFNVHYASRNKHQDIQHHVCLNSASRSYYQAIQGLSLNNNWPFTLHWKWERSLFSGRCSRLKSLLSTCSSDGEKHKDLEWKTKWRSERSIPKSRKRCKR